MYKYKHSFTLIEILVVLSIIALLAGLSFESFGKSFITAARADSNNRVIQITKGLTSQGATSGRTSFGPKYLEQDGIRSVTQEESKSGEVYFGGNVVEPAPYEFEIFAEFKESRPFDDPEGYYFFSAVKKDGSKKPLFSSKTRLAMEFYDYEKEGDRQVCVGFGDGHVELISITTPPGDLDLVAFLSIEGGQEAQTTNN